MPALEHQIAALPLVSSRIVLLAFTGPLVPRRGLETALAGEVGTGLTIVAAHLLRVPLHLPIDAQVVEGEARARELLAAVQVRGARAGVRVVARIARGRSYRHALGVLLADGGYARVVLSRAPAFAIGRLVDTVACELVVVPPERLG